MKCTIYKTTVTYMAVSLDAGGTYLWGVEGQVQGGAPACNWTKLKKKKSRPKNLRRQTIGEADIFSFTLINFEWNQQPNYPNICSNK